MTSAAEAAKAEMRIAGVMIHFPFNELFFELSETDASFGPKAVTTCSVTE